MRWSIKKRRLWYKLTGKPVWYHRRCIDYEHKSYLTEIHGLGIRSKPKFLKAHWVMDWTCPTCHMHMDSEDFIMKRTKKNQAIRKIDPKLADALDLEWDKIARDIQRNMNLSKGST